LKFEFEKQYWIVNTWRVVLANKHLP